MQIYQTKFNFDPSDCALVKRPSDGRSIMAAALSAGALHHTSAPAAAHQRPTSKCVPVSDPRRMIGGDNQPHSGRRPPDKTAGPISSVLSRPPPATAWCEDFTTATSNRHGRHVTTVTARHVTTVTAGTSRRLGRHVVTRDSRAATTQPGAGWTMTDRPRVTRVPAGAVVPSHAHTGPARRHPDRQQAGQWMVTMATCDNHITHDFIDMTVSSAQVMLGGQQKHEMVVIWTVICCQV